MDDDLDVTNDAFLRDLVSYLEEIDKKLTVYRESLQCTVDSISDIEVSRELCKNAIEHEFTRLEQSVVSAIRARKQAMLDEMTQTVDDTISALLKRAHVYQIGIGQAANLQTAILALQKHEVRYNPHIQTGVGHDYSGALSFLTSYLTPSPPHTPKTSMDTVSSAAITTAVKSLEDSGKKEKGKIKTKAKAVHSAESGSDRLKAAVFVPSVSSSSLGSVSSYVSVTPSPPPILPSPSPLRVPSTAPPPKPRGAISKPLSHSLASASTEQSTHSPAKRRGVYNSPELPKPIFDFDDTHRPTTYRKQKLINEIRKFLLEHTPECSKPTVAVSHSTQRTVEDLMTRIVVFGGVRESTGSYAGDLRRSVASIGGGISSALGWSSHSMASYLGISKRREEPRELETIPPPLLVVHCGIDETLAEDFVELLTIHGSMPAGCVIPVVCGDGDDRRALESWLSHTSVRTTAIVKSATVDGDDQIEGPGDGAAAARRGVATAMTGLEGCYFGHESSVLESDQTEFRPVHRTCLLLFDGARFTTEVVNQRCDEWEATYELKSLFSVEMRAVGAKRALSSDCPKTFLGTVFYDRDGIIVEQESVFEVISKGIFE